MTAYAHINTVPNGSTGGIMMKEHKELLAKGEDSYVFWGRGRAAANDHEMKFATNFEINRDVVQTRLDGKAGFHSKTVTKRLLARLDEIKPDVVHLHNLHGYYVNIEMLFEWLAASDCHVEWTLHDCWAFTGHCAYFTYTGCDEWKNGCAADPCPQLASYPKTLCKTSCSWSFNQKKRLFNLLPSNRMTLVTPSQWLANLVGESFLSKYPVRVQHNTIDTSVFKSTPSDFRERYGIGNRFMVLGVANPWSERKGFDDFIKLASFLNSKGCVIVLVGLEKKQIYSLPSNVIGIPRVDSSQELAGVYSAADVFFNPTREDNYPATLLEAQACGTRVVTYSVGGCEETLYREDSQAVSSFEDAFRAIETMRSREIR